jgi:hypothetical protein
VSFITNLSVSSCRGVNMHGVEAFVISGKMSNAFESESIKSRGSICAVLVELAYICVAYSSTLPRSDTASAGNDGISCSLSGVGGFV